MELNLPDIIAHPDMYMMNRKNLEKLKVKLQI